MASSLLGALVLLLALMILMPKVSFALWEVLKSWLGRVIEDDDDPDDDPDDESDDTRRPVPRL